MLHDLLIDCRKRLEERGFNLWGTTSIADYDSVQCRGARLSERTASSSSAVVIGSGGRELWSGLAGQGRVSRGPRRGYDPIDAFSREVIDAEAQRFRAHGFGCCAVYPFEKRPINFLRLAESAGIGVISPVVPFLLHPEYGPWISLRGALVFAEKIAASDEIRDFDPCTGCASPCLSACPVSTYAPGEAHVDRCAGHRHAGGCATGCEVRRACPVGKEHRYAPEEEAFRHAYSLPTLRRWYGLGMWRLVPRKLRRLL